MKRLFKAIAFLSLAAFLLSITLPFNGSYFFLGRMLVAYLFLWPFLLIMAVQEAIWHPNTPLHQSLVITFLSPLPTLNVFALVFLILRRKRAWKILRPFSSVAACLAWVAVIAFAEPVIPLCIWSASITLASIAIWLK
jgi:hypothetical protein